VPTQLIDNGAWPVSSRCCRPSCNVAVTRQPSQLVHQQLTCMMLSLCMLSILYTARLSSLSIAARRYIACKPQ